MRILQLYWNGQEMLATDGIMYTDNKLISEMIKDVRERNKQFEKNFPHKVADAFAIYRDKIDSKLEKYTKLSE